MTAAVIVFPGSNCDRDVAAAIRLVMGKSPAMIWHKETGLPPGVDLVVLPGGFSFGDYLRPGAIASRSPAIGAVRDAAARGVPILGICNGFQILTEAALLPGAVLRNAAMSFVSRDVSLAVGETDSPFTRRYRPHEPIVLPVAHRDGNYTADEAVLDRLEGEGRVAFRYVGPCNGSARSIAGIVNDRGNVLGMMPHPERAVDAAHGNLDGRPLFEGVFLACERSSRNGYAAEGRSVAVPRAAPSFARELLPEG